MSGQNILKREEIGRMLKEHPALTDRAIATKIQPEIGGRAAIISSKTVANVRKELERERIIPYVAERYELDGRKARGRKPAKVEPSDHCGFRARDQGATTPDDIRTIRPSSIS